MRERERTQKEKRERGRIPLASLPMLEKSPGPSLMVAGGGRRRTSRSRTRRRRAGLLKSQERRQAFMDFGRKIRAFCEQIFEKKKKNEVDDIVKTMKCFQG